MPRHSFKLSTVTRALRAARSVGVPVDRVEIDSNGSVILHMEPAESNAREEGHTAPQRTAPATT